MKYINLKIRFLGLLAVMLRAALPVSLAASTGILAACSTSAQNQTQAPSPTATNASGSGHTMDHGNMNHSMGMDLGPADAEYDLRFIDAMTPHHQGALEMAQEAKQKSKRPEIQKLANEIIKAQNKEITQMKQWRTAWYPKASAEPVAYHSQMGHSMPMSQEQVKSMMMNMRHYRK